MSSQTDQRKLIKSFYLIQKKNLTLGVGKNIVFFMHHNRDLCSVKCMRVFGINLQ